MAPSKEQSCEIVKLYYQSKSLKFVVKTMKTTHPELEQLSTKQIQRTVKRFEASGSVEDGRHSNPGRPRSVRTPETIEQVKQAIDETLQKSVRRVLGDITNTSSATSMYRMLKYDIKLTPYKVAIMQHLKPTDIASRLTFAEWMTDHIHIAEKIWFTDEAHFYLNAEVNKQNCRYWSSEKPDFYVEKPLHGEKITVWAALSADGIVGPFFFEDAEGNVETINTDRYLQVLKKKFLPALRRKYGNINSAWFQQDGWHRRINAKAGRARLQFYVLVPLLLRESHLLDLNTQLVTEHALVRHRQKKNKLVDGRLEDLYDTYDCGDLKTSEYLIEVAKCFVGNTIDV